MNELEQLKAKYQELGAVIERMEKGEAEFKPLGQGWYIGSDGSICDTHENLFDDWSIMATEEEAERLYRIFQAVAEQEHLVRFVNGVWEFEINSIGFGIYLGIDKGLKWTNGSRPDVGSPRFKDSAAAERALKLASPNLLAYWKREL